MSVAQTHPTPARALAPPVAARSAVERRRAWLRLLRRVLLALAALAAVAGAAFALRPKPVAIDVGSVRRGPLRVEVRESGMTRLKERHVVLAPVGGQLLRVSLEANDDVTEGEPLAQIAPAEPPLLDERARAEAEARLGGALSASQAAEAQTSRAATARELAERELARARTLRAAGAITAQSLEQAEFAARLRAEEHSSARFGAKVAAEEVRLARAALARQSGATGAPLAVLAPIAGQVLRVHRESPGPVSAGAPLFELGDLAALEVVVDLLTTDAVRVRPGTPGAIEGWGGDGALAGRVRKVELAGFTRPSALGVDEQRANVIITLAEPRERWALLGDGYRVEVRLTVWQAPDVLQVPLAATFRRGEEWAAFRVEDGVARLVPITLGQRGEADVQVLAGLAPGDTVALSPSDRVSDGARVAAR